MCGSISPREREMMRLEYEQMLARQAEEAEREIEMTRELIDEPLPETLQGGPAAKRHV